MDIKQNLNPSISFDTKLLSDKIFDKSQNEYYEKHINTLDIKFNKMIRDNDVSLYDTKTLSFNIIKGNGNFSKLLKFYDCNNIGDLENIFKQMGITNNIQYP